MIIELSNQVIKLMPYLAFFGILTFGFFVLAAVFLAALRGEPRFSVLFKELSKLGILSGLILLVVSIGNIIFFFLRT